MIGKDKSIVLGIIFLDIITLILTLLGYYSFAVACDCKSLLNIHSVPSMLTIYVCGYLITYIVYPSIVQERITKPEQIALRSFVTAVIMLFVVASIIMLLPPYRSFSRTFLVTSIFVFVITLMLERLTIRKVLHKFRSSKRNQKHVVLVGNDPSIIELYVVFNTPHYGYNVIGTFYKGECDNKEFASKRIGEENDIFEWITKSPDVAEIYAYTPKENGDYINLLSKFCDNHLIRFYYVPSLNVFKGNIAFNSVESIPVVARREEPLSDPRNKLIKRMFDLVFSAFVLLTIFPIVFLVVAIIIKIKSPGPIFFVQNRTGVDGKVFKCIKFRSMKVNDDADKVQATKNDPRKFPFGNFMRKSNIDELPQFINVLLGDMSVVGPRPHMLKHTEEYSKLVNRFMVRHFAKPGITGLAQVTGFRGETKYIDQMEGRVKKDIEYVENWTFFLDIRIIVQTITNTLFRKEKGNAY